ncbi:MAG TPA: hypothetical protein VGG39_29030 [Polyangiaceae bacterium]|jgi:hypothetical protein
MKIHILLSCGLAASALLFASDAAYSGGSTTNDNMLVDYDQSNKQLTGIPPTGVITTYLHDATAVHEVADLASFLPPDPCIPTAEAWNLTVAYDERHHTTSTFVFDVLLEIMSNLKCSTRITSTSGTPNPIVVISPVAK